jgi:hypothetical protein
MLGTRSQIKKKKKRSGFRDRNYRRNEEVIREIHVVVCGSRAK